MLLENLEYCLTPLARPIDLGHRSSTILSASHDLTKFGLCEHDLLDKHTLKQSSLGHLRHQN